MSYEAESELPDLAGSALGDSVEGPRPAPVTRRHHRAAHALRHKPARALEHKPAHALDRALARALARTLEHGPAHALEHAPARPVEHTLERMSGMSATTRAALRSRAFWQQPPDAAPLSSVEATGAPGADATGAPDSFAIDLAAACDRFPDDLRLAPDALRRCIAQRLDALARRYRAAAGGPPRRVLVVGAGPVGLRCAIGAALAGHQVTVLEHRGRETRARYLGLFAPEQHFLADLGAPRSMFVELALKGVPKRLVTIADLQGYLEAIARELGVELHWGARASFTQRALAEGAVEYRSPASGGRAARVAFDLLVDASGTGSELRQLLVGERVVGFRTLARDALAWDGTDPDRYFSHEAAPGGAGFLAEPARQTAAWASFAGRASQLHPALLDSLDCFVGNFDPSIFIDGRVPDLKRHCPPDWIYERFSRPGSAELFRVHLEGPFPRGARRLVEHLRERGRGPTDVIAAFLETAGASMTIDRAGWHRYQQLENSAPEPAHNTACIFRCRLAGVQTRPDRPTLWGPIPGAADREYFIAGDAAQAPWYRFGVGIMDGFHSATVLDELLRVDRGERAHRVLRWERYLRRRAVQVLFSTQLHEQRLRESPAMLELLAHHLHGEGRAAAAVRLPFER